MIPFVDLQAQYASVRDELEPELIRAAAAAHYILGQDVSAFEADFASYVGARACVGVNSGTAAIHLGLEALGVGKGDEVIAPANTFVASVLPALKLGAKVVLVDCDDETGLIDVEAADAAVTARTRALVAVHLYGQPVDLDRLAGLCDAHDIALVEDACQAHGSTYNGRRVGSFGRFAAFSFYPSKNLGALGDGGAVTTNDEELADRIRLLGRLGERPKGVHVTAGWNERLDTLQAAALRVKLRHLDSWNARRRQVATHYGEVLRDTAVDLPVQAPWAEHVWHLYVVRTPEREALREALTAREIGVGIHYPLPVHLQPGLQDVLGYRLGEFPVSERRANDQLSLPIFAELTADQVEEVAAAVRDVVGERAAV
jgi:dTDP-4-amino-4,6-dideoxygalactose transaminase